MHFYYIVAILSAAWSVAVAAPACTDPRCQTDSLLFDRSLGDFLKAKAARSPAGLIWDDDGCTKPAVNKPRGYNFLTSCYRHDFGYRNYKKQGRFSESNRGRIDRRFKDDLYGECRRYSGTQAGKGIECRRIADLYYEGVKRFGSK